jgi:anti-sigma factor RsiW
MSCHEIQELILDAFDGESSPEIRTRIDAHVLSCAACARFALAQQALDTRLTTYLPPPVVEPMSRPALRARLRRDAVPPRRDTLPEMVHFASFGIATVVMASVLPVSPAIVAGGGLAVAFLSFALFSAIRSSFEDYPLEADA